MGIPVLKKTTEFRIEKGIPIPTNHGNTKYPWADMEIGDSFFIANTNTSKAHNAAAYQSRRNKKFVVKAEGNGVRIWRAA